MLEESDDYEGSLREKLQHKIDFFDTQQSGFFAQVGTSDITDENLSTELTEADFADFIPDNLSPQHFEKIEIENFISASTDIKLLMIEQMKKELNQNHYKVLRVAEKDADFQVKCIAKIALGSYKDMSFNEVDLMRF